MMEKSKKYLFIFMTAILSVTMSFGFFLVGGSIVRAGTSTTFNLAQYEDMTFQKKVNEYTNAATLTFDGNTEVAVNTTLHGEGILATPLVLVIETQNMSEGYDASFILHGQIYGGIPVNTSLPENTDCSAKLVMIVPDGYNTESGRYYDNASTEWKSVLSHTENSVTIPLSGSLASYPDCGMLYQALAGALEVEFKKSATDIATLKTQATIPQATYKYTGSPIEPEVTIPGLTKDKDYKVEYAKNTDVGTATITIKGIYNCYGSFTIEFTIEDANKEADKDTYKDTKYTDEKGGAEYILNTDADGNITATYTGTSKKKAKKITIPSSITLPDGTTAKVTQIDANAFKGSKAKQITIPSTVTKISAKAFAGSEAKKIIIKTDKKGNISIGKGAFKKMKAKNVQIIIKGCKGKAKEKLVKKIQKQAPKGTKVK